MGDNLAAVLLKETRAPYTGVPYNNRLKIQDHLFKSVPYSASLPYVFCIPHCVYAAFPP